jgi:hypothetical protein
LAGAQNRAVILAIVRRFASDEQRDLRHALGLDAVDQAHPGLLDVAERASSDPEPTLSCSVLRDLTC